VNQAAAIAPQLRTRIDRQAPIPYYVQLKEALSEPIADGRWRPGDRLPGEPELCRLFGVSRTVVRQALKEMTYEGLVVREKGRGTFVAPPKISSQRQVQSLDGFYQDMADRGLPPVNRVLEQAVIPAPSKVAAALGLQPGDPVVKLIRLRFVQEEPMVLVTAYLPQALCPGLEQADLAKQSLYAFLESHCGLVIARGLRRIEAVLASEYEAGLLEIDTGAPLLRLESTSYLKDGTPIEYYIDFHRGDRTRFEVEIAGHPAMEHQR
jgi:GntR family transcriptional regulator